MSSQYSWTIASTAVGISLASSFASSGLLLSYSVIPTLLLPGPATPLLPTKEDPAKESSRPTKVVASSSHLVRQWKAVFDTGKKAGPFTAILSTLAYLNAGIGLPSNTAQRDLKIKLLAVAGVLNVLVVPYTWVFMNPTNNMLLLRASDAEGTAIHDDADAELTISTEQLLNKWASLNLGRSIISLIGIAAAIASLAL